jgi:GT2 family glycosyltransferase
MSEIKKILIGLPNTGYYHFMTVSSIVSLAIPPNFTIGFRFVSNCLIYDAREKLAEHATNEGYDYLLFIDSDMVLPGDTIVKMLEDMNNGAEIVTGMIFKRSYPYQPCFYPKARLNKLKKMENGVEKIEMLPDLEGCIQWEKDSIIPLEGMGMACCMIDTNVFKRIAKPWFYPFPHVGEDITFCIKARQEAKAKMVVDTRIDVGHITNATVTSEFQKEALRNWESDPANQGKLLYMEAEDG